MPTEGEVRASLRPDDGTQSEARKAAQAVVDAERMVPVERPHGGAWIAGGWALLTAGVVAAVLSFNFPDVMTLFVWIGAGFAQLGLALLVTGAIVRAIYHLPGRVVTKADLE